MTTPNATVSPTSPTAPLHSGIGRRGYLVILAVSTIIPLDVGLALYGWRGACVLAAVVLSAIGGCRIWRRIGRRGLIVRTGNIAWLALLLAMMLPAHLFAFGSATGPAPWPLLPAAGLLLVIVTWLLSDQGSGRLHPVLVTYMLLYALFHSLMVPHYVLRVDHLFFGDALKATPTASPAAVQPWYLLKGAATANQDDALYVTPAAQQLVDYTSWLRRPERASFTLHILLRDQMPPLENLIIAGEPGPLGISSALAVVLGGLYLLYRGLIDYRIPLLGVIFAAITLLIAPLPVLITPAGAAWRWLAFRDHVLGPAAAITFVNYQITASPLLFALIFLATSPALRPMTRRGRGVYAIALGVASAIFQLYVSVAIGPYLAVLIVSLLTPTVDKIFRRRTLV